MMVKLSRKTMYLAVAACVLAVCVVASVEVFVLGPQRKAIRLVQGNISEIEQTLVDRNTNGHSSNISALKQKLSTALTNLSRYVISPEQALDLTVDIGKIAGQAAVTNLRSTNRMQNSYGPINECQHVREGRIQVNFKSSFSQFAGFINLLERNHPVIFVDYFKIKRSDVDSSRHDVEMVLTFFVGNNSLKDIMETDYLTGAGGVVTSESGL